jgi:hypothetical protein
VLFLILLALLVLAFLWRRDANKAQAAAAEANKSALIAMQAREEFQFARH